MNEQAENTVENAVEQAEATEAKRKGKKEKGIGKVQTLLSVGGRGTAFVRLGAEQIKAFKLGEENAILAKARQSKEQFAAYKRGENCGVLWVDSASWLTRRADGKFWIGTLKQAEEQGLVRKAAIRTQDGSKFTGYVRADWNAAEKFDQSIACERGVNGRIETIKINDKRNLLYYRKIEDIKFI